MHALTTSDLAFLLCTSTSTSPPKAVLSLRTTYGLHITRSPDGSLSISISPQKQPQHSSLTPGSLNSILHSPTSIPISKPQLPPNSHYLLSPDFTTSTYLWSPNSASLEEWVPADETLFESLDSGGLGDEGSWFDAYLGWVGRAEDQMHKPNFGLGPQESSDSFISIDGSPMSPPSGSDNGELFQDEGERTLWIVEGVLLAAWLALQEGVEGVGYRPGGFGDNEDEGHDEGVYLLEKDGKMSLGEAVERFLKDVKT